MLAIEIVYYFLKGTLHSIRLSLARTLRLPYAWPKVSGMARLSFNQAWPQPSPISDKMPYAVLHLPPAEIKEFLIKIVARFQRQVAFTWIAAIRFLSRKPHLECPDDAAFVAHLTSSVLAYFVTDKLSDDDIAYLGANGVDPTSVHKSDLTPVSTVESYDGHFCTGSAVFLRETGHRQFTLIGIAMVDKDFRLQELLRPEDGDSWSLAKMHVMQGATYLSLFVTHPKCHFPMDAIIAVTRAKLPREHRVRKLLEPHMYLQMPLDYSVLHIKNGPGFNDPRLYYTAFSGKGRSQYRLFEYAFAGLPGHAAYPAYSFGHLLRARRTDYMDYLLGYYEVVLSFVRTVVADLEIDETLLQWAKDCAHYSKGFFGPDQIRDREQLAVCLAYIVWNCSVVHSADHWEIHDIPFPQKPTRLRVAPPFKKDAAYQFDVTKLTNVDDRLRHYMWHELYLRHWLLKRLCDVDYEFEEDSLKAAQRDFMANLASYDAANNRNRYIPIREICSSVHY